MMQQVVLVGLIALGGGHLMAKLHGPLGLAGALRWLLTQEWLPTWVRSGAACPFCWAFWTALGAAWLLLPPFPWREFVAVWLAGYGLAVFGLLYTGH